MLVFELSEGPFHDYVYRASFNLFLLFSSLASTMLNEWTDGGGRIQSSQRHIGVGVANLIRHVPISGVWLCLPVRLALLPLPLWSWDSASALNSVCFDRAAWHCSATRRTVSSSPAMDGPLPEVLRILPGGLQDLMTPAALTNI